MSDLPYVVVGGGFAGLVAARELGRHAPVIVLEARDRLGGRAWTAEHFGQQLEMGATWVHWLQPHVWAEMSRYGLGIAHSPDHERSLWMEAGAVREGAPAEYAALLERAVHAIVGGGGALFPEPHDPTPDDARAVADALSIAEKLDAADLSPEVLDVARAFWSTSVSGPISTASTTAPMRLWSLSTESLRVRRDASVHFRIAEGMSGLIAAIAADVEGEIRTSSDVAAIRQHTDSVTVELRGGEQLEARGVIVALPVDALRRVEFAPGLPSALASLVRSGQNSSGLKVWALTRGHVTPFSASATPDHPLTAAWSEWDTEDGTVVVAFGPDAGALELTREGVERELRVWLPDVELQAIAAHPWVADPFTAETFGTLRPGQLTRALPAVEAMTGRVLIGGGDLARGWLGFVDGAIQSGFDLARRIREHA